MSLELLLSIYDSPINRNYCVADLCHERGDGDHGGDAFYVGQFVCDCGCDGDSRLRESHYIVSSQKKTPSTRIYNVLLYIRDILDLPKRFINIIICKCLYYFMGVYNG